MCTYIMILILSITTILRKRGLQPTLLKTLLYGNSIFGKTYTS